MKLDFFFHFVAINQIKWTNKTAIIPRRRWNKNREKVFRWNTYGGGASSAVTQKWNIVYICIFNISKIWTREKWLKKFVDEKQNKYTHPPDIADISLRWLYQSLWFRSISSIPEREREVSAVKKIAGENQKRTLYDEGFWLTFSASFKLILLLHWRIRFVVSISWVIMSMFLIMS